MGSPSSASSSSAQNWTGRISYYREIHLNLNGIMCDSSTAQENRELAEVSNETILLVRCYKVPLGNITGTCFYFYHRFVVFRTTNSWWSIEKNDTEIVIQRGKQETDVKDKLHRKPRNEGAEIKEEDSFVAKKNVSILLKMLADENETCKKYHLLTNNCKAFGKRVFEYIRDYDVNNVD